MELLARLPHDEGNCLDDVNIAIYDDDGILDEAL